MKLSVRCKQMSGLGKDSQPMHKTAATAKSTRKDIESNQQTGFKATSKDSIVTELSMILSYVSDFLGKVPEVTRRNMCGVTRMEHFKKDDVIFNAGDEPDKFYIILTGQYVHAQTMPTPQDEESRGAIVEYIPFCAFSMTLCLLDYRYCGNHRKGMEQEQ